MFRGSGNFGGDGVGAGDSQSRAGDDGFIDDVE